MTETSVEDLLPRDGALKIATPAKPIRRDIVKAADGLFLYKKSSMMVAQIGEDDTIRQENPEAAYCSAQSTSPLPPHHSRFPATAKDTSSDRVGLIRMLCARAIARRIKAAAAMRSIPRTKGGNPFPGATPIRMAR